LSGIITLLKESGLFCSIEVMEFIDEESVTLIKVKAVLPDSSVLFIHELHTVDHQKYSYHWQDKNNHLILRWDNKPHWKDHPTFPHHVHEHDVHEHGQANSCHRVTIDEVIAEIKNRLSL
jgi:hypothetical protein